MREPVQLKKKVPVWIELRNRSEPLVWDLRQRRLPRRPQRRHSRRLRISGKLACPNHYSFENKLTRCVVPPLTMKFWRSIASTVAGLHRCDVSFETSGSNSLSSCGWTIVDGAIAHLSESRRSAPNDLRLKPIPIRPIERKPVINQPYDRQHDDGEAP